jgi:membrane-associated phospholipid phosphatase
MTTKSQYIHHHDQPDRPHDQPTGPASSGDAARFAHQAEQMLEHEVAHEAFPRWRTSRRARILAAVYLIGVASFVALAVAAHAMRVLPDDVAITRALQADHAPLLLWLMSGVSALGYFVQSTIIFVVVVLLLWLVRLRLEAIFMFLTLSGNLLNELLKFIVDRQRPTSNVVRVLQPAGGPSFPSGHVMHYTIFYGLLAFLLAARIRSNWWRNLLIGLCLALIVLVGPSRVYLGAHWSSDVVGAYLAGALWLGLLILAYQWMEARYIVLRRPPWIERRPVRRPRAKR